MDYKFLSYLYKKPWLLKVFFVIFVVFFSIIISSIFYPSNWLETFKFIFKIPLIIFSKIISGISREPIDMIFSYFIASFFANLGLRLWNPIIFPLKWRKIFSLFFLIWSFVVLVSILFELHKYYSL